MNVSAEFSELEEAFFREGDEMAATESAVPIAEVIDISSRVDADYYASIAVTIEADAVSGGFEVAA